jgi:uncharacterized protein (DUF4213/DUF364 family)
MEILDDVISSLDVDVSVADIRQGVFHTGVLSRHCGLAATLPRDALRQDPPLVKEPGRLLEKSAGELVAMACFESILEAAIGMAAINSLIEIDDRLCVERNGAELVMEKGRGKRVAVVGHFPFVPRIRECAETLWVIENNPKRDDLPASSADRVIPAADVVCITGTALTTHTLERLLDLCDPAAYVVMIGDTVPLSPVLFDWGVDALAGTTVADAGLALRCVSQGANFRQIRGTRRVTMVR